jgi:Skp family chaperone for outer membrane proteins
MREIDDEFARARRLLAQMQDATKKLEEAYEDMQRAIDAKLEHDWDRGRAS